MTMSDVESDTLVSKIDEDSDTSSSSSSSVESDMISDTESDSSEEKEDAAETDALLSVEELRKKYSGLESPKIATSDPDSDSEPSESSSEQASATETVGSEEAMPTLASVLGHWYPANGQQQQNGISDGDIDSNDTPSILPIAEPQDDEEIVKMLDSDVSSSEVVFSGEESSTQEEISEEEQEIMPLGSLLSGWYNDVKPASAEQSPAVTEDNNEYEVEISKPVETAFAVEGIQAPKTPIPSLLRGQLRIYQHAGLDWLSSLYENNTNGILADEMGLGKTIQTISLIAHLAVAKHSWGPYLIIVPTSVMLNWELEFKKFAPGFKLLVYYGNPVQRRDKRRGWSKDNSFHVCITSYQLALADQKTFRRRRWSYLILDEAHNIKNFRSQRWQTLLNFNADHRLLLTGTPLQNNLMELWSLLYFLMPQGVSTSMPEGFANLKDFQEWFSHPVEKMVQNSQTNGMDPEAYKTVTKLHQVLRPYILRRLKADVEKQMPAKYEHVLYCKLSKRQRFLYDDFMSRAATKQSLASGNFMSIINCLMQLRKVCNHPDLFETRPITTSWAIPTSSIADYEIKELLMRKKYLSSDIFSTVDLDVLGLILTNQEHRPLYAYADMIRLHAHKLFRERYLEIAKTAQVAPSANYLDLEPHKVYIKHKTNLEILSKLRYTHYISALRSSRRPLLGSEILSRLSIYHSLSSRRYTAQPSWDRTTTFDSMVLDIPHRIQAMSEVLKNYVCVTPKIVVLDMPDRFVQPFSKPQLCPLFEAANDDAFPIRTKQAIAFPDKRLLQYDCGKLQQLDILLRELIPAGHRALIFTQMTKVLNILEQFLNIHGHRYLRLDGATKIEQRQAMTERFNTDDKIPVFILSSRSGGLGINLTGADTVIFYDSDWNPCMDRQCQDR